MVTVSTRRREALIIPLLVIVSCAVAFGYTLHRQGQVASERVVREDAALALLNTLAVAQHTHHRTSGSFGWLDEYVGAGYTLQLDDVGSYLEQDGYRFDVLLPAQRQDTPVLVLSHQGAGIPHPDLRKKHFAVVARPTDPGRSGYRTYYVDDSGFPWQHEGVSDEEMSRRNLLPSLHLTTSEGRDTSARLWTRIDLMVPRGTRDWEGRGKK